MNVAMLVSDEIKQRYVAAKVAGVATISGIVVEKRYTPRNRLRAFLNQRHGNPVRMTADLARKMMLRCLQSDTERIIRRYFCPGGRLIPWPSETEVVEVPNVNDVRTLRKLREWRPEVVVVFGTGLVGRRVITFPPRGAINVHTGLSPYYRGGQSAFWALYCREPQYIGATVHYLSPGIDSGDIIHSGRCDLSPDDTLATIECKLCLLGTDLLVAALREIEAGTAPRIRQWTEGKLFLSSQFTLEKRLSLERAIRRGLIRSLLRSAAIWGDDPQCFPPRTP